MNHNDCPFREIHYKKSIVMFQLFGDEVGDTESYYCNCCGLSWPTEEAKKKMDNRGEK
jgi:hypothetical protein